MASIDTTMLCTRSMFLLAVTSCALQPLLGQAVRGGDVVTTNYGSPAAVFRVEPSGAVSTLYSGAPLAGPSGITVTAGRDVIVADFASGSLYRIDGQSGAVTTAATGLGGPLRVVEDFNGDLIVTAGASLLRVDPAGVVTTIASAPMVRPFGVGLDLNGDYLVADDQGRRIHRVTRAGGVTTIYNGTPLQLPQGVTVFSNGDIAVIDGLTDSVFRIDRISGAISTWVPAGTLAANPCGLVPDWTGGLTVSYSQGSGSGIVAIDELGGVAPIAAGAPFTNLEDLAVVPQLRGPQAVATGPGAVAVFDIDAPTEAGRLYSLILSASVYPGWQIPGDTRTMPLDPDAFFFATIGQNAPPVLVDFTGFLDGNGQGTATLDLQLLPPGFFSGLTLYAQFVTVTAQNTLGDAGNPLRLVFP